MKVVCTYPVFDTYAWKDLVVGQVYECLWFEEYTNSNDMNYNQCEIKISKNNRTSWWYDRRCFVKLEEWRDIQLNKIGV